MNSGDRIIKICGPPPSYEATAVISDNIIRDYQGGSCAMSGYYINVPEIHVGSYSSKSRFVVTFEWLEAVNNLIKHSKLLEAKGRTS